MLVVVLVLVALAIAALVFFLFLEPKAPAPGPKRNPLPAPIEQDETEDGPGILPPTPEQDRHGTMVSPYPWTSYVPTINELKQPPELEPGETIVARQGAVVMALEEKITIRIEGNLEEVVAALNRAIAGTGRKIITGEPAFNPHVQFKLFYSDIDIFRVFDAMVGQAPGDTFSTWVDPRPDGALVVGSLDFTAIERVKIHDWDVARRLAKEHTDPILDTQYRPDFSEAQVETVAAHILAQTGVPVIADALVWERRERITWRGEPMTLRDAMEGLSKKLRCHYRVKNGRVYLMVIATSL